MMIGGPMLSLMTTVVLSVVISTIADSPGCRGLGRCCPGRDLNCSSTGQRPDSKDETSACFCDEECLVIGDCCLDYRAACRAVDCVMAGNWEPWSDCNTRCGYGMQVRTRRVLVHPVHGGRECGDTVERRLCEGTRCKLPRSHHVSVSQLKETASIVPASYAGWRSNALYSPFEDIRQNLFMHLKYAEYKENHMKPSYCAKFEVTETRAACHRRRRGRPVDGDDGGREWTSELTPGSVLCVECQQFAALQSTIGSRCTGHGVLDEETAWKAVTIPRCHGKWRLLSRHVTPCQCDTRSLASFVFI